MKHVIGILAFVAIGLAAPVAVGLAFAIVCRLFLAGWKLVMP